MERRGDVTLLAQTWHAWNIRLRGLHHGLADFLQELRRHPTALVGGTLTLAYLLAAVFAPHISPHDPLRGNLRARLLPPAWEERGSPAYPLGTDLQGRDLFSRIIFGARVSLLVGFLVVGICALVGTALGAITGYYGGRIDDLISRLADLLLAWPYLIFAIGVMAFLGPGFVNLIMALTFKGWVEFFRLVRGEMLSEKTKEYVEAARAVGQSDLAIILSEILPNIFHSILVLGTLRMGSVIIMEASLSFLGLGIQPPTPAWGSMVAEGRDHLITSWWVSTLPGLAILVLVLSINLFGEGLRDILDPRLRVQ
ncbi:MAG TPA: ABC transporter permease, partial [Anaerolineae bacterium]|nr:ABC transporter permease [Anaerolineae bacterium]